MKNYSNTVLISLLLFTAECTMDMREKKDVQKSNVVASDTARTVYQCPMKCEGDTAYTNAGACPVCNMDLEKVERPLQPK